MLCLCLFPARPFSRSSFRGNTARQPGFGDNSGTGVEVQSPAYALHEQQFFLARGRERLPASCRLSEYKPWIPLRTIPQGRYPVIISAWWSVTFAASTLRVFRAERSKLPSVLTKLRHGCYLFQQYRNVRHDILRNIPAACPRI